MNQKQLFLIVYTIMLIICFPNTIYGYKVELPNDIVHQYITNESQEVWSLIPQEIKYHLTGSLRSGSDNDNFNNGDNIINGSSEEDKGTNPVNHFWEPDNPNGGEYDNGLPFQESSYERSRRYWITNVIPNYLNSNINESYYWLGRTSHLLEDATVPAHMHLDTHPGSCALNINDDALECFTVLQNFWGHGTYNYRYFDGKDNKDQYYKYENLVTNFSDNNWSEVNNRLREASYSHELFKLFWYTAQKTQYWASDNNDGTREVVPRGDEL